MPVTKISIASGLFTNAATWSDCDATAENDSEATSAIVPTSAGASSDSAAFTPGAITVSAIAVRLNQISSNAGTFTATLRNSTLGADVVSVTVNLSDMPQPGTGTQVPYGWLVFAFAPTLLLAATNYVIRLVRSGSSSQISMYVSSGNNWSRQLRISGAAGAGPATGDKLIIAGEYTGAGTSNSYTVTGDNTAATVFGGAASQQAFNVCSKGTYTQQVTASTAYILNVLGNVNVYAGGVMNLGTNGAAMPADSSLTLTFQNVGNVDCGLEIRALGTVNAWGNALSFVKSKLAADAEAAATSLTTADSTGWANGDEIALASTTRTASECEKKSLTAGASGTTLTIAALTNAHSGSSTPNDTRGELANLTRNVKILGNTSSLGAYVNINATATVVLRYCEFSKIGSGTALKRGIDVATTTGSFDCQFCSIHDCTVASSRVFSVSSASGSSVTISNNVTFNVANEHLVNVATTGVHTYDGNLFIRNTSGILISLADSGCVVTNNVVAGATSFGISIGENGTVLNTFSGNVVHSGASHGLVCGGVNGGSFLNCVTWRNSNTGFSIIARGRTFIDGLITFGNASAGINIETTGSLGLICIQNCVFNAGATLTQPIGINLASVALLIEMFSNTFGATQTHATGDLSVPATYSARIIGHNNLFSSATTVASQSNLPLGSLISSAKHNQTVGSHRYYTGEGTVTIDTTAGMFDVTPAARMTPIASAAPTGRKLEMPPFGMGFQVPVANGNAVTVSVKVRESVSGDGTDYDGARARLMVRRNVAAGISADTVLATATSASAGAYETIQGTTAAVTDDAVLEFYVDCDFGTGGWVDVDTFEVISGAATDARGTMKYWFNGSPFSGWAGAAGGGGGSVFGGAVVR